MATLTASDMFADYPELTTTNPDDLTRIANFRTLQRRLSLKALAPLQSVTDAVLLLLLISPRCQTATTVHPHQERGLEL